MCVGETASTMASGKAAFEALFDGRWEPCHVSHADTSNAELQYTILGNLSGGEEWWEVVPASRVRLVDETSSVTFPGTKRGRKKAIFPCRRNDDPPSLQVAMLLAKK